MRSPVNTPNGERGETLTERQFGKWLVRHSRTGTIWPDIHGIRAKLTGCMLVK